MNNNIEKINKKVDAALILASGMGLRMAPLTYDTPKCMLMVNGERLIERQIKQLKEKNINEIIIMVGYLKETFEYLVDKYNVKLVYNNEYNSKNTLSTLYKAIPYIQNKNIYISVADIYLAENVYNEYEKETHFKGKYIKEQNNEWPCTLDENDNIIKIDMSGKDKYCMVGIAYFDKNDTPRLFSYCDKYYHQKGTEKWYWEEIIDRHLFEFKDYKMYKLPEGAFNEFDTFDELKSYTYDKTKYGSTALSFVANAFKVDESYIENITLESKGMTNRSYIFSIKGNNKKYIARVPGVGTNEYVSRENESDALLALQDKNITEKIIYIERKTGYKIAEYYENVKLIDSTKDSDLIIAMNALKKLHDTNIQVQSRNSLNDLINRYVDLIIKYKIENKIPEFNNIQTRVKDMTKFINTLNRPISFCHGDANPNNMLKLSDKVLLIDFEYATMSDPLIDIALFADYEGFAVDKTLKLYKTYKNIDVNNKLFNGLDENNENKLYLSYIALAAIYGAFWGIVNEHLSKLEFKEYINNQLKIFNDAYNNFMEVNKC